MAVHPQILKRYPTLNSAQKEVISNLDGPLLVIAGPGSGKTFSIVLRAMNILLLKKALPNQILLCTFTDKASLEMRDRLAESARNLRYDEDLSEMSISTIHGWCNRFIMKYRHRTELGHNYETLDEMTQLFFVNEHFDAIFGSQDAEGLYLHKWETRRNAIKGIIGYFNKITEELVDSSALLKSTDPFLSSLGKAYLDYCDTMYKMNRVDFAHLQVIALQLLQENTAPEELFKYVLVDEYQDTNYIQEQLLVKLTCREKNLCVVGDEDQSLYRFRGGTVRNILEFHQKMPECKTVKLTINYRSHKNIVEAYDRWMASADWDNSAGPSFRYDKTIRPNPDEEFPEYPAIFQIRGTDKRDEVTRFADLVTFLKKEKIIEDYSQVALLLHSVREDYSQPYIQALEHQNIPAYCPRSRSFFELQPVKYLVAIFAILFEWYGETRGQIHSYLQKTAKYVDQAILDFYSQFHEPHPLVSKLREWKNEFELLKKGETLDLRPADYFYRLLALSPYNEMLKDENIARNLAIFSQLLSAFQQYYHYRVITHKNFPSLKYAFFQSFVHVLYSDGINEYEDVDQPFPKGYVQIMTIHQAKGLEFPVVVVGSLDNNISSPKKIDRDLGEYYHRPPFEPESRITLFDRMRLHYVAFSRPQNILVLTSPDSPKEHFRPIWQGLPQWPYVKKNLLVAQHFSLHKRIPLKKTFSFTGDLKIYETCPRQYQFFREYEFVPSRSSVIFFGLLVHQTIEEIHREVLEGKLASLSESKIKTMFDRVFRFLSLKEARIIDERVMDTAFKHVMNYFEQNQEEMKRVVQTEVDVSLEKGGYILTGKVDLLMGSDGKMELLDFKTSPRPVGNHDVFAIYEAQLCTYAHILESRYKKSVERLLLYWTSEPLKENALIELPYDKNKVKDAGEYFDKVVSRIQNREFTVYKLPETKICQECDLRRLCALEGIIPHS